MSTILLRLSVWSALLLASTAFAAQTPAAPRGAAPATPPGANDPAARFRGPLTYDFQVSNVTWKAATSEYSFVTFDLYWSYSWRAKWTEPAKTSATGKDMEIENWDAAWVFVKFLPDKDSKAAKERNHWQHATLDRDPANHVMAAGATSFVKLSDDGVRGMGLFIYRDALGHGVNDWKNIKLRWNHGTDGVDPAKAAVRAYAIPMVYVPEGPFKLGTPEETGFCPFADGPDTPRTRFDGEQNFLAIPDGLRRTIETTTSKDGGPYLRWSNNNRTFQFTDGAWRGGKAIPFLLDREWNGHFAEGTRGRRIGPVAGWLWSTHTFSERAGGATFGGPLGGTRALSDDYPTGYDAFYCMKYDVTQGLYCDYLNSLPPDVAAGRAFVSTEEWSAYSPRTTIVKERLPSGAVYEVTEKAGNTIRSSADVPAGSLAVGSGPEMGGETPNPGGTDLLPDDVMGAKKKEGSRAKPLPVYWARLPFRRLQGFCWDDIRAFSVWAGLRPMTVLEAAKAGQGARDPAAPPDPAPAYDEKGELTMADDGMPAERPRKGLSRYGADYGVRVGCFATPTSDQATARASYWGITEFGGLTVPLLDTGFRGAHGNGIMPAGKPGASWKREFVAFTNTPPDWGRWDEYSGRRHAVKICRVVISAGNRTLKPGEPLPPRAVKPKLAAHYPPAALRRDDVPRVANVKLEPGKSSSTVTFDLAWRNSWRAKWTEPAEKNVTGKPLTVESWDAAWVFVKFRPAGAKDEVPAILAKAAADHQVPAGAELNVGLTDDGRQGVGVFVFRQAPSCGANDFRNVKLRWAHGAAVDPTQGAVKVYALAMVYVPEGPFASRSPWGHALKTITDPDATKAAGHLDSGLQTIPQSPEWPNGFRSFYCMKYSITQGEYADFLNSITSRSHNGGRYGVLAHNNARWYSESFYKFNGNTLTTKAGVFLAEVPDRFCNLLSLPDIQGFTAWAGLRPPTNLEYEKACRGPRAVARGADAWTQATCAPAAGLDASVLHAPSAVGPGPSYWGIRELSLSGCVQEWPAVVQNEPANPGLNQKGAGVGFNGTHGSGSPTIPEDWPLTCFGDWYSGGIWRLWGYGTVGHWINADEYDVMPWETMDGERCGRYGVRAVRTASESKGGPLTLDDLPSLSGAEVAWFNLSGSFRNDGDTPLKLELTSALPAACFPQGAASRTFTAAAKAVTPFKAPVVVTSLGSQEALRGRSSLAVQIQGPGAAMLAERRLPCAMVTRHRHKPRILSLDGGKIELLVKNATEAPVTLAFEMPSLPEIKIGDANVKLTVAAGGEGVVAFPVPPQAFPQDGPCQIPYRVSVGSGQPLAGEVVVELQTQTRWWLCRRVPAGPNLNTPLAEEREPDLGVILPPAGDVFRQAKPTPAWQAVSSGPLLPLASLGDLPVNDAQALAVTRVFSPAACEALVSVPQGQASPFLTLRVWVDDDLVFDSHAGMKEGKRCRLRPTGSTVMVEGRSTQDKALRLPNLSMRWLSPKDQKPIPGLIFDIDKR